MYNDLRFISGIYNYCDRWCKHCLFTSRCLNYAMTEKISGGSSDNRFVKEIQKLFDQAYGMINEIASERGMDTDFADAFFTSDKIARRVEEAENHCLAKGASEYSKKVDEWFKIECPSFDNSSDHRGADLEESVEVIQWYKHLVSAKLSRALYGNQMDSEEAGDVARKDSDGSVKAALIGMDRSIGAWGRLKEYFPHKTDKISVMLLHLDRLRGKTELEFPGARAFVRPGFDVLN